MMEEAINNVISQFAIENANLRLRVEELRLENKKMKDQDAEVRHESETTS